MAKKRSTTSPAHAALLIEALRQLTPAGPRGFEGLLRDLLSAVTGQHFRLLKSGHQGGIDVASERFGNGLAIGLEGKRYGDGTELPLDELKSKLIDAAQTHPGLDLWVLAATREISATDAEALAELGDRDGIAVEVIDWPSSPAAVPPLGVLCAAAPDTVAAHIGGNAGVADWLASLRRHDGFDAARGRLIERLTRPDVGYAAARRHLSAWLRRSFADEGTARANLDTFANILDPSVKRVGRAAVETALDSWWADRRRQPVVLLGDEGVGKTWAALSWWHERAGPEGGELPLTLVIPARHVDTTEPERLLAVALAQRTKLRTAEFWRRRLHLWLRDREASRVPKLLVTIDGLNQNWMFRDWGGLLQGFFANEWQGQVAAILTCRPDHWRDQLKGLPNLRPPIEPTVRVGRFDDGELDSLLRLYGVQRSDFSDALLGLMRVPRLFRLA